MYQSENQSLLFIVILGSLTAFGPLAIDMFLPGLPNISHDFEIFCLAPYLILLVEKNH